MPIAVEFAKHVKVIGFNHNEHRIQQYKSGIDPTNEVGNAVISKTTEDFISDEKRLAEAKFIFCCGNRFCICIFLGKSFTPVKRFYCTFCSSLPFNS